MKKKVPGYEKEVDEKGRGSLKRPCLEQHCTVVDSQIPKFEHVIHGFQSNFQGFQTSIQTSIQSQRLGVIQLGHWHKKYTRYNSLNHSESDQPKSRPAPRHVTGLTLAQ